MRKFTIKAIFAVYVLTLALAQILLSAPPAHAYLANANDFKWLDSSNIDYADATLHAKFTGSGGTGTFSWNDPNCSNATDSITIVNANVSGGTSTATGIFHDQTNGCKVYNNPQVFVGGAANSVKAPGSGAVSPVNDAGANPYTAATFAWVDDMTITATLSSGSVTFTSTDGKTFTGSNGGGCNATISNIGADFASANMSGQVLSQAGSCRDAAINGLTLGSVANQKIAHSESDGITDCDAGPGFTWIICGVIRFGVSVVDTIRDKVIVPFLYQKPLDNHDAEYAQAWKIWQLTRDVAGVLFILLFVLLIFGSAIGFDNYTVKKALPHLIAGAILMPLSWYICAAVIDLGNVLGGGIQQLVNGAIPTTPHIDLTSNFSKIFLTGVAGAATLALVGAVSGIGLGMLFTILIAFAGVFLTLIFRRILIIILVVISPLAIAAWILPNTEKWAKKWWDNLLRVVMMYPIIMMLFMAGRLFSATAGAATGDGTDFTTPLFQIVGLVLPLFAVPFAYKFAGSGLSMGANAVGKLAKSTDSKVGKNSDLAKTWQKNREARNMVNQGKLQARAAGMPNTVFGKVKKFGLNTAAAGLGSRNGAKTWFRGASGRVANDKAMDDAVALRSTSQTIKDAQKGRLVDANGVAVPMATMNQRLDAARKDVAVGIAAKQGTRIASANQIVANGGGIAGIGAAAAASFYSAEETEHLAGNQKLGVGRVAQGHYGAATRPDAGTIQGAAFRDRQVEMEGKYGGIMENQQHYETVENEMRAQGRIAVGANATTARLANARADGSGKVRKAIFESNAAGEAAGRSGGPTAGQTYNSMVTKAQLEKSASDAGVDSVNEGLAEQMQQLMDEDHTLSPSQARQKILTSSRAAQTILGKAAFRDARGKETGVEHGLDSAVQALMDREAKEGRPIDRAEATRQLYNSLNRDSARTSSLDTGEKFGKGVANVEAFQEAAIQTEAESLAKSLNISKPEALARVRDPSYASGAYAKGAGVNRNVFGSVGARQVIQQAGAQKAMQEGYKSTLAQLTDGVKTAQADENAVVAAGRVAANDQVEQEIAAAAAHGVALTPAQIEASRARALTHFTSPAGRAGIRNQMSDNIATKAGTDAERKVQDGYNAAQSAANGEREGRQQVIDSQIDERTQQLLAEARANGTPLTAAQARQSAARMLNARADEIITDTRNRTAVHEGSKQAAALVTQPIGQDEAQQAALNKGAIQDQIEREADLLQSRAPNMSRNSARLLATRRVNNGTAQATQSTSAEATSAVVRLAARAKQESAKRSQTGQEAAELALDTAARSASNPSATLLLDVQQRSAEATQARQEGEMLAREHEETIDYSKRVADQQKATEDKLFEEAAAAALKSDIMVPNPAGGMMAVRLESAELGSDNVKAMEAEAIRAFDAGEDSRVAGILQKLGNSSGGREAIRRIASARFGRDDQQTVDPSDERLVRLYNLGVSRVSRDSAPDLHLPPNVSFDELKPNDWQKLDKRTMGHYLDWAAAKEAAAAADPAKQPEAIKTLTEVVTNFNGAFGPNAKSGALSGFEPNHFDAMRKFLYETTSVPDPADPTKTVTVFADGTGAPLPAGAPASALVPKTLPPGIPPIDSKAYTYLESTYVP